MSSEKIGKILLGKNGRSWVEEGSWAPWKLDYTVLIDTDTPPKHIKNFSLYSQYSWQAIGWHCTQMPSLKKIEVICLFCGPLIPLFWTYGGVCPEFQSGSSKRESIFFVNNKCEKVVRRQLDHASITHQLAPVSHQLSYASINPCINIIY